MLGLLQHNSYFRYTVNKVKSMLVAKHEGLFEMFADWKL